MRAADAALLTSALHPLHYRTQAPQLDQALASTGVITRIGSSFDTFGIAWRYRWGAGL